MSVELKLDYKKDALLKKKYEQTLSCRDCNTDKLYIIQVDWTTYAMCPKCLKYTVIHDG